MDSLIGKNIYIVNNNNYSFAIVEDDKKFNSFNMNLKRINNQLQDKKDYIYDYAGKIIDIKIYAQLLWKAEFKNIEHYSNFIILFLDNGAILTCHNIRLVNTEFGKVCILACENNNYLPFTNDYYLFHKEDMNLTYSCNNFHLKLEFIINVKIKDNKMYNLINDFFTNYDFIYDFFQYDNFMRDNEFREYVKNIIKFEIDTIFNNIDRFKCEILSF